MSDLSTSTALPPPCFFHWIPPELILRSPGFYSYHQNKEIRVSKRGEEGETLRGREKILREGGTNRSAAAAEGDVVEGMNVRHGSDDRDEPSQGGREETDEFLTHRQTRWWRANLKHLIIKNKSVLKF